MNRGLNRKLIFHDEDGDRAMFKQTLEEVVTRWSLRIHAFSLMDNHYHLLVETPIPCISRAMRHLDGVYTQRFNRQHGRDGPLFRGRFKSILVEKESYFLELVRYIHLNGVRAKRVLLPQNDPHSSHGHYVRPKMAPSWLEQSLVLSQFGTIDEFSRKALHEFVLSGIPKELEGILGGHKWPAILGHKSFVESVRVQYLPSQEKNRELPQKKVVLQTQAVASSLVLHVIEDVGRSTKASEREIRWAKMHCLRKYSFLTMKQIGNELGGVSYKCVQKYLQRNNFEASDWLKRVEERLVVSHVAT